MDGNILCTEQGPGANSQFDECYRPGCDPGDDDGPGPQWSLTGTSSSISDHGHVSDCSLHVPGDGSDYISHCQGFV